MAMPLLCIPWVRMAADGTVFINTLHGSTVNPTSSIYGYGGGDDGDGDDNDAGDDGDDDDGNDDDDDDDDGDDDCDMLFHWVR